VDSMHVEIDLDIDMDMLDKSSKENFRCHHSRM
jgi:hypothetical protein